MQDSRRQISSGRSKERPVTLLRNLAHGKGRELESNKRAPFFNNRKKKKKKELRSESCGSMFIV